MADHVSYAAYLQQRSLLGKVYRNWLLYPRLSRYLTGKILDFGCGIGDFLRFRPEAQGVDINPLNVRFCCDQNLDVRLIEADGHIPYPDHHFDSAVMDNVLEHIPEESVDDVLKELLRVLRPGGRLLIGVPGVKGFATDDDHQCFYTEGDLLGLFKRYGCCELKSFHMPLHMPRLQHMLSQYCIYVLFETRARKAPS